MRIKAIPIAIAAAVTGAALLAPPAFAAVGEQISKSMSDTIHDTTPVPLPEAEHAFIKYLRFYVPAQTASGEPATVPYNADDGVPGDNLGELVKDKDVAKPLISVFLYGQVEAAEPVGDENSGGFAGHGLRDAYGAISLDDGQTWKQTNLSESATQSSLTVSNPAPGVVAEYPGDVTNMVHATAGRNVVVAWQSRYCATGTPGYNALTAKPDLADYLGIVPGTDLYLDDVFGVAGNQGSVDYTALGYPSVGEIPFNCLWTARGVLVEGDDPRTDGVIETNHMVWYKPERLTSGRRDVNRVEIQMVADAGAAITWQEDPDGLLPGSGQGPGEGWSGAIANSQTDVWYSFLPWEHFQTVDVDGAPTPLTGEGGYWPTTTEKPGVYVPFAVPMRLTNNARCNADGDTDAYCDGTLAAAYSLKNQCADTVDIPLGPQNNLQPICVSEDGLPNVGNMAATRARLSLQARDSNNDGVTDSAWVVVISEESKGMGRYFFKVGETGVATATPCTEGEADCEVADDGKNIWYYSFDMGKPQTSADTSDTSLVRNLVSQGNLINQPETDWRTGEIFPPMNTADMWDFGAYNFDIYRTEIARRGSLMVQPLSNVAGSQLTALLLYKQGLMNQGGPADIMARRVINAGASVNPYDFANLVCEQTLFTDGSNPYYPKGVCMSPAINMSGVTPTECTTGGGGDNDVSDGVCPTIDESGIATEDPMDQTAFDKVVTWIQCPGSPECGTFDSLGDNLDDQSWHNPLDVAKGHRGYLWGDLAVVMYAWSPNWKLNAKGSDRYELYIRRSFDGGRTWTTTPTTWGGAGTTTCELMRDGETASDETRICTDYVAGAPEQARNVSQLRSQFTSWEDFYDAGTGTFKLTVLDPRYAPDPPTMPSIGADGDLTYDYDSDEFNPSRFFVVFETGDNTTVSEGEAEPLDLYYGRAVAFGDHYQVWATESEMETTCLPGAGSAGVFCNEFDRITTGSNVEASEASLAMSPAGDTLYAVWAQLQHDGTTGDLIDADAAYARVWYDDPNFAVVVPDAPVVDEPVIGDDGGDTYVPPGNGGGLPGTGGGSSGCAIGDGKSAFDPLLPGFVLLALGYLALRRRMGKVLH